MSVLAAAAQAYAARGWRVVPSWGLGPDGSSCQCHRGAECGAAGKHPRLRDWTRVASCDPAVVAGWWAEWPDANVSIVTGSESGLFVVDVDPRHGGEESLDEYEQSTRDGLPATMVAVTGGGGRHLFYAYPPVESGFEVGNSQGWLQGVDVRGEGGQVVAPPSAHSSGGFYTWASGWEEGPAAPPVELLGYLSKAAGAGGPGTSDLAPTAELMAGVPEGERNSTLFRMACRLRRQLNDERGPVEVLVREAAANCNPPVGDAEVTLLLDSAFRQDHTDDLVVPVGWGAVLGAGEAEGQAADDLPCTDLGNAQRLVRASGDDLKWSAGAGWWAWDGRRWVRDLRERSRVAAQRVATLVAIEAEAAEDPAHRTALQRWAQGSQGSSRITATLREAQPALAVDDSSFDADPWLLNLANVTVDLRSLRARPHSRADLLTRSSPARWVDGAECPRWDAFLATALPDPNVRWFVQKAVGYSLTGVVDAKVLFVLYGSGDNGKSVFLETLREALLGDYATTCAKSVVMETRNSEHATVIASLAGARFVTLAEEVGPHDRLDGSWLKSVTGGDQQRARFMRQDEFRFTPQLKLWIGTNHRPGLTDFGRAMTSRLRLVPFEHTFSGDERRDASEVKAEFAAEAPGILGWAMRGLEGWTLEGLAPAVAMEDELGELVEESDAVGAFIAERCDLVDLDLEEDGGSTATELYLAYSAWAASCGMPALTRRTLVRDLAGRREVSKSPVQRTAARRYGLAVRGLNAYGL